jgi:large subunit ribosomal protein L24
MYIKTGDIVQVTAGRDKGKRGSVKKTDRRANRVVVEGVNVVKRHKRPSPADPDGGIVEKEATIHVSNVMLFSEKLERGVRVSYRFVGSGGEFHTTRKAAIESFATPPTRIEKVRYCVKTGEVF